MTAIGSVREMHTPTEGPIFGPGVRVACCVAAAALAILVIALSSWANANIACVHGGQAVIIHSPYTIMLPITLVALCAIAARVLWIDKVPDAPKEQVFLPAAEVITPNVSNQIAPDLFAPIETSYGSPFAGKCCRILVQVGDVVELNTPICVLEAMKMETIICAHTAGTITALHIQEDAMINQEDPLYTILPERDAAPGR